MRRSTSVIWTAQLNSVCCWAAGSDGVMMSCRGHVCLGLPSFSLAVLGWMDGWALALASFTLLTLLVEVCEGWMICMNG
jgi:hypothetical protein